MQTRFRSLEVLCWNLYLFAPFTLTVIENSDVVSETTQRSVSSCKVTTELFAQVMFDVFLTLDLTSRNVATLILDVNFWDESVKYFSNTAKIALFVLDVFFFQNFDRSI